MAEHRGEEDLVSAPPVVRREEEAEERDSTQDPAGRVRRPHDSAVGGAEERSHGRTQVQGRHVAPAQVCCCGESV